MRVSVGAIAAVVVSLAVAIVFLARRQAAINADRARERQAYADEIKRSNELYRDALAAAQRGQRDEAARLTQQANAVEQQANARAPLRPEEATELDQLRKQSAQGKSGRAQLERQIDDLRRAARTQQTPTPAPTAPPTQQTPVPTAAPTQPPQTPPPAT